MMFEEAQAASVSTRRNRVIRIAAICSVTSILLAACIAPAALGQNETPNNHQRIRQARRIIAEGKYCQRLANDCIAQADKTVESAKRLRGDARFYDTNFDAIHGPQLKGKNLQAARKQYHLDLTQFAKHQKDYDQHTKDVRTHMGMCKASLDAYEKMRKDYSLHCDQFHLPDVPPPLICIDTTATVYEAQSAMNRVREANRRVAAAEEELAKTNNKLQKEINMSSKIDAMVMKKSELALREQDLAAEFARLKEEHRQLEVERKALSQNGIKVAVPQVQGTFKP